MAASAPPLDCIAAMTQLWDYLDGELTPERMAAVRRHLVECADCLPHARWARTFLDALASSQPATNGAGRGGAVRARVLTALREAGYSN